MKKTGVTRRIDELGRIVIPKEIRRMLSIRDGESLEIIIENDQIILKKYLVMQNLQDLSNKIINIYESVGIKDIIITDREKVISTTSNLNHIISQKISNELLKIIDNREQYITEYESKISFEHNELVGYYTIYPIINESDSLGLIIIYKDQLKDIKEDIKYAKIISKILSEKININ